MIETVKYRGPVAWPEIEGATRSSGFTMASDVLTCSLLSTLAASKPGGHFLELGTGTGLATSWILYGMDKSSSLTSIDNEPRFLEIAERYLGNDERLKLILADGGEWIKNNRHQRVDYIFADTWFGKYLMLEEVLSMLNKGGFYIIDDMLPQPNWPEGHDKKALKLMEYLEEKQDLVLTRQDWATGTVIAVKK